MDSKQEEYVRCSRVSHTSMPDLPVLIYQASFASLANFASFASFASFAILQIPNFFLKEKVSLPGQRVFMVTGDQALWEEAPSQYVQLAKYHSWRLQQQKGNCVDCVFKWECNIPGNCKVAHQMPLCGFGLPREGGWRGPSNQ